MFLACFPTSRHTSGGTCKSSGPGEEDPARLTSPIATGPEELIRDRASGDSAFRRHSSQPTSKTMNELGGEIASSPSLHLVGLSQFPSHLKPTPVSQSVSQSGRQASSGLARFYTCSSCWRHVGKLGTKRLKRSSGRGSHQASSSGELAEAAAKHFKSSR